MRRFKRFIETVIESTIAFLRGAVTKVFPPSSGRAGAPAPAVVPARGHRRVRGVHLVPLVAVLALGATAFAVNTGAAPDEPLAAVETTVPQSTTTVEDTQAGALAKIEKLAAAQDRETARNRAELKQMAETKAKLDKAQADQEMRDAAEKAAAEKAAAEEAAAAQAEADAAAQAAQAPAPPSASGACGGNLPPCCVMMRESGGNTTVVNTSSGAAGKWQFMNSTWANYRGYPTAAHAPEWVQDERAAQLWAGGAGASHWGGGCW